jgi:hypothetical protein
VDYSVIIFTINFVYLSTTAFQKGDRFMNKRRTTLKIIISILLAIIISGIVSYSISQENSNVEITDQNSSIDNQDPDLKNQTDSLEGKNSKKEKGKLDLDIITPPPPGIPFYIR